MESNVADQKEQVVQIIRYAPYTWRPHSPAQSPWRGPPPRGVNKITTRAALGRRASYAKWASNFALLTDEFIAELVNGVTGQLSQPRWKSFKVLGEHSCKIGDNYLWVQEHPGGCTIELCYPDNDDPDARILTIENMPVLCRDVASATRLAEACYPKPPANLVWHSYW
jgi:hypothetical protein